MWFHQVEMVKYKLVIPAKDRVVDFSKSILLKEEWVVVDRNFISMKTPKTPSEYHDHLSDIYQDLNESSDQHVEFHFKFSVKES
mgnify:FL=1